MHKKTIIRSYTFALGAALAVAILLLSAFATSSGVYAQSGDGEGGTIPFPPVMPEIWGARIAEVVPDSPAAEAGLEADDVVVSVQGTAIDNDASLSDLIQAYVPDDLVTLEVVRADNIDREAEEFDKEAMEDAIEEIEVTLGANPEDDTVAFLGVRHEPFFSVQIEDLSELLRPEFGSPLNPEDAPDFSLPERMMDGVIVLEVVPDSPAADAGLEPGDRIVALNGDPISQPQALIDLVQAMQPGDKVMLSIETQDGDAYEVEVTLADRANGNAQIGVAIGSIGLDGFGLEELNPEGDPDFRFFEPRDRDGQDREDDEDFFRRHGERDGEQEDYERRRPHRQSRFMRFLRWLHNWLFGTDYERNERWERFQENHF